jgi:membrane protein implicated in regulation of membrane protease activity
MLCLSIIAILLAQAISLLLLQANWLAALNGQLFMMVILIFVLIAAAWLLLKPSLQEKRTLQQEFFTERRFKSNPDILSPH